MKITGGVTEKGIVVGNAYDKYGSKNPIVKWMMKGFEKALSDLIELASPKTIYEVGCGEGYWVIRWHEQGIAARGCDFSRQVIAIARENAKKNNISPALFDILSIYDLKADHERADLIVCCEVLEHLEFPDSGLQALQRVTDRYLILSVPREPLWCTLNLLRGKYIADRGNTPGHIQHWTRDAFLHLVSTYFEVVEVRTPVPWVMLLCRPYN